MRADLIGMPCVHENQIYVIRAAWVDPDRAGTPMVVLIENERGELSQSLHGEIKMLVPQVMSSYSASNLTELFPDLLAEFGRREIIAIWTLGLGFDGPLRERIKYGIVAFTEGRAGELAAFRTARDAGMPQPWGREPSLETEIKGGTIIKDPNYPPLDETGSRETSRGGR
jgi:hypothetical protein